MSEDTRVEYEKCFVAFLDILRFKNKSKIFKIK